MSTEAGDARSTESSKEGSEKYEYEGLEASDENANGEDVEYPWLCDFWPDGKDDWFMSPDHDDSDISEADKDKHDTHDIMDDRAISEADKYVTHDSGDDRDISEADKYKCDTHDSGDDQYHISEVDKYKCDTHDFGDDQYHISEAEAIKHDERFCAPLGPVDEWETLEDITWDLRYGDDPYDYFPSKFGLLGDDYYEFGYDDGKLNPRPNDGKDLADMYRDLRRGDDNYRAWPHRRC